MFAPVLVALAALASTANAVLFITAPVASTSWAAGTQQTISWQDDGTAPDLKTFGPAKVTIGVGNAVTQTQLQTVVPSVDVSTTSSILFTPDPSIGTNGNFYFVRFESISAKDPAQPQYPLLAFSAKFTMTGMTGTFNSTVQAQIDGSSTAPLGGPTSAASSPAVSTPAATPSSASKSASGSASRTGASSSHSAAATGASQNNGAMGVATSGVAVILGSIAALGAMVL
ncbi:hypothetical protein NLI96_g10443 [Meripilus lineatus]|uniref:Yeast cell wall synthesis Kre9/Knh1-like N-terminal domain-containing protein n=1 Tax=Meripilus lineatus TaxID=2056292 RepID=A0AAD5UYW9_9APHY|nr:hypothetical protein NLI96_g10443 [Physisporinus lineatus]